MSRGPGKPDNDHPYHDWGDDDWGGGLGWPAVVCAVVGVLAWFTMLLLALVCG